MGDNTGLGSGGGAGIIGDLVGHGGLVCLCTGRDTGTQNLHPGLDTAGHSGPDCLYSIHIWWGGTGLGLDVGTMLGHSLCLCGCSGWARVLSLFRVGYLLAEWGFGHTWAHCVYSVGYNLAIHEVWCGHQT